MTVQTIAPIAPHPQVSSRGRTLGAIFLDNGVLAPEGVSRILKLMQEDRHLRFGEAAMKLGLVSRGQVDAALAQQLTFDAVPRLGVQSVSDELVVVGQPFCAQADELRAVATQLLLRWFDGDSTRGRLAVVSPGRGDGRSFVAANLAVVLSQLGRRTLLIDGDLKVPRQHQVFQVDNRIGFASVLAGEAVENAVQSIKGFPNLHLMTAGPVPVNSLELLGRPGPDALFGRGGHDYDVVLFDTPALAGGMDGCLLALRACAALVVARSNETPRRAFADMVRTLRRSGCAVVGSLLNDPTPARVLAPMLG